MRRLHHDLSGALAALIGAVALLLGPAPARATSLTASGELGAGTMLSGDQRHELDYGLDVQGSIRPGVVLEPFVLQLVVSEWLFPSSSGYGRATLLGGGLRVEPPAGDIGRLFADAHAGAGLTGGLTRFMFDVGAGIEWPIARELSIGPVLRYGQVHANSGDGTGDAKFWSLGASLTWRAAPPPAPPPIAPAPPPPPPKPEPPQDRDGDGIPDASDACPDQPAGPHPDPKPGRKGCPVGDSDKDGVTDDVDQCPDQPSGPNPDPERAGCPDRDSDGDGVLDHQDQCPQEAAGMLPDRNRPGCPAPDRDRDFVADDVDACPDKPGAPSDDPKKNGCPGLVVVDATHIRINKPVFFATNKDTILKKSFPVLQAVADALKNTPGVRKVSVQGHTDNQGTDERNLDLSQRRADSVRAWLVEHGVAADRLEAKGYGSTQPIGTNKTAAGRAHNRRVEFTIVDPAQPAAAPVSP